MASAGLKACVSADKKLLVKSLSLHRTQNQTIPPRNDNSCMTSSGGRYVIQAILLLLTTNRSNKPPEANTAAHAPPSQSLQCLPLYTLPGSSNFSEILFMTSSHPNRGRPALRLALDGWPKRTIFGNFSSFIRGTCPGHLNLYLIIALDSGIEPHFSYWLLFEIRSVSRVSRTIRRQWKTSSISSSAFWSTQVSEPYLTTVIAVASNNLVLVSRLTFLFFQTFYF